MLRTALIAMLLVTVPMAGCMQDDAGEITIAWVEEPEDAHAGDTIQMEWELSGPDGEIPHTAVHYGEQSVDDPQSPADYEETAGLTEPADVPATYTAEVTFDEPGTYYLRAHAILEDNSQLWTDEVEVTVTGGGDGNVSTPVMVEIHNAPSEAEPGENITVNWSLTGVPGQITHTGLHWADFPVDDPQSPADYGNSTGVEQPAQVPGDYNGTFNETEPGTYYARAHAIKDGNHYWSDEIEIEVGNATMDNGTGPQVHVVEMVDLPLSFQPDNLTVRPGDTIKWINNGSLPHTATFENETLGDSGNVQAGANYTLVIPEDFEPGTYHYVCTNHETAGMVGDIVVNATGNATS